MILGAICAIAPATGDALAMPARVGGGINIKTSHRASGALWAVFLLLLQVVPTSTVTGTVAEDTHVAVADNVPTVYQGGTYNRGGSGRNPISLRYTK